MGGNEKLETFSRRISQPVTSDRINNNGQIHLNFILKALYILKILSLNSMIKVKLITIMLQPKFNMQTRFP